ncbi:MAG: SDR family oxidoreductase [Planctomycetaceae bacterium]
MNAILITGGAGFVGSHIAEECCQRGWQVRILDNLSTSSATNLSHLSGQVKLIDGSITDAQVVRSAMQGVKFVFHQAALASVPRSVEDPVATHDACATGTLVLLDEARRAGVKRFVYAASSSAYGDQPVLAKSESLLPSPLSPYAAAKLAGEYYCQAFFHTYGLETVCLRYFNVFGPRQDPNGPYAAVIPLFVQKLLRGDAPRIFGDGLQTRDFCYVKNVVAANLLAVERIGIGGQVFNVGGGSQVTLLALLDKIKTLLKSDIAPRFEPARTGDVRDSLADLTKSHDLLGYNPAYTLDQGLAETVAYYQLQHAPK